MGRTTLFWLVALGCSGVTGVAVVQEETLSYPCEASAPSHRIDLPLDAGEGEKKMQWMHGNTAIATYPPSRRHPSVLDVDEWGIVLSSCMNLTLLVVRREGRTTQPVLGAPWSGTTVTGSALTPAVPGDPPLETQVDSEQPS
ncbi:multidrug ABC transporter ATPase [Platysternon megacephalum]|uniref:Multidrug ABC transporter ATPase n=1 Tax=Platysternon megacephalum TaxID=55544 RepID=A0A4D9DL01_9SAUR|nr:multidrug ABC transporter ATPase [Platysternon megacephalum]